MQGIIELIQTGLYICWTLFGLFSIVAIYNVEFDDSTSRERSIREGAEMFPKRSFKQAKRLQTQPTSELIEASLCAHLRKRRMKGTIRERKTKIDRPYIVSYER